MKILLITLFFTLFTSCAYSCEFEHYVICKDSPYPDEYVFTQDISKHFTCIEERNEVVFPFKNIDVNEWCKKKVIFNKTLIDKSIVIDCILGEAASERYEGMLAVAEALRNRDSLKGVYGCNNKNIHPMWVRQIARRAWKDSKFTNVVKGATYWENIVYFGLPPWNESVEETVTIGAHTFFKEKR